MFGLKLETQPDLISVQKMVADLHAGHSSSKVTDCDLFVHSSCAAATFCGTCPAAHSDTEQLAAALEDRGFRRKMIFSAEEPSQVVAVEMVASDGSGSVPLDIRQGWLRPGVGRPWMRDESNPTGLLIGLGTLSVIAARSNDAESVLPENRGNSTLSALFRLALQAPEFSPR